jgi:hypothetical protein
MLILAAVTLGKTMSARLGVEIMSTSTCLASSLLQGLPSSSFFTLYGTHLHGLGHHETWNN